MTSIRKQTERCVTRFRDGTLTEADLLAVLDALDARPPQQSLLYLQASSSSPHAGVIGISLFEDGHDPEGLDEQGNPRYRSVREAIQDGWRVIRFPETTLAMDDENNYGLGYEFILERWR